MSRLAELIQDLCPNGVEEKKLRDIVNLRLQQFSAILQMRMPRKMFCKRKVSILPLS